ncbi:SGNH/GDSL hydrolase family protein [Pseudochrobactrum kiredjianiae]|uniref:SGNH/GDSL hydrolase family protein n=1 Tax=Pseudochrobactrum kiredjianiae TaxID=386305 RepID=A0ABW3V9N1_9HYPH|nr:SGNH/GDSL hydrolase family protein [Pseudochrobactrum kiredjianiae]MDM7851341.1 SGNH/GDSL hydrolase family protein [Pseudochrobactrum kiredjianiae]
MKSVLCFGDSLTWGYQAPDGERLPLEDRWPSVLQKALGSQAHVIAEGLNGRTTAFDDYTAPEDRNGSRILPTLLGTHAPLDLVIILLGSNDMKPQVAGDAFSSHCGTRRLIQQIRNHPYREGYAAPDILIVAPPHICESADPFFASLFAGGIAESRKLGLLLSDLADETECNFFDASGVAKTTPLDGVHLDAENTRAIGQALEPVVRLILGL